MSIETQTGKRSRFAELPPTIQTIILNGLRSSGLENLSTSIEIDASGALYFSGDRILYAIMYGETGVNTGDGYDAGSLPKLVRTQV